MFVGEGVEHLQKLVLDALLHEEPGPGKTHLSGIVELARSLPCCSLEVGIGEHQQGSLAPELGGEGDDVLGRRNAYVTGCLG